MPCNRSEAVRWPVRAALRSFYQLAFRNIRARKLRVLLTTLGIVLGVGMIFGVLLLSFTMLKTFQDLYSSVYGKTDLIVSGKEVTGSVPFANLRKVRRISGVKRAEGDVQSQFGLVDGNGRPREGQGSELITFGIEPSAHELFGMEITSGRIIGQGRQIMVEQNWAKGSKTKLGQWLSLATPNGVKKFKVIGLFKFGTGLGLGDQGFAFMPMRTARKTMDKHGVFSEINIAAESPQIVTSLKKRIKRALGRGAQVQTPNNKSENIQRQLQGLNIFLYFTAGMALFVGAFIIFNSFSMTMLQRMREIGMLRTIGATRRMIVRSVLLEALLLGLAGSLVGIALGYGLALLLAVLVKIAFGNIPLGEIVFKSEALAASVAAGMTVTVLGALVPAVRAGRIAPVQAVLGSGKGRSKPKKSRAVLGTLVFVLGLAGVYLLASSSSPSTAIVVAGIGGVVAIFLGVALIAPVIVSPMAMVLSWPMRKLEPVEGRLASDSARMNPARTAATASALMIGLAMVTAFSALGSSFLKTISDEFDETLARDFTVQPRNLKFTPGTQLEVGKSLTRKLKKLPHAKIVTPERFVFLPDLVSGGGIAFGFNPPEYKPLDNTQLAEGDFDQAYKRIEKGWVSVGIGLAKARHYKVGDRISLKGPSDTLKPKIAAVVKTAFGGGMTIGMSLKTMKRVYGVTADSDLAVKATSEDESARLKREIERVLKRYPNMVVLSNSELKANISDMVNQQFNFFYAILLVAIFVSLFGIINTLSMNVLERTREIGVLRALGSSRWQIRRAIGSEGVLLSLVGAVLGIAIGFLLGYVFVKGVAVLVPSIEYAAPIMRSLAVAAAAIVLGLVAAIIPARRAARLNIIEAVSYE